MTVTERKPISPALRKKIRERDKGRCQKCNKTKGVELHHIIPVAEGQIDTLENLISLCRQCHREWEYIIYSHTDAVTFHDWIKVPPALELIKAFANSEIWKDDITAKQARDSILMVYNFMRDCHPYEDGSAID